MRVVICEDDPLIAEAYRVQLEAAGHVVTGVADRPDHCLALCREDRPDVALVDLQLADGQRGETLVEALADIGIPAIIVSGEARLMRIGTRARGVLRKSPKFKEVLRALKLVEWTGGMDQLRSVAPEATQPARQRGRGGPRPKG